MKRLSFFKKFNFSEVKQCSKIANCKKIYLKNTTNVKKIFKNHKKHPFKKVISQKFGTVESCVSIYEISSWNLCFFKITLPLVMFIIKMFNVNLTLKI